MFVKDKPEDNLLISNPFKTELFMHLCTSLSLATLFQLAPESYLGLAVKR